MPSKQVREAETAPAGPDVAQTEREFVAAASEQFQNNATNEQKVIVSMNKNTNTVTVLAPIKNGNVELNYSQNGQFENATHIGNDGKKTPLTQKEAESILKQNGYNINLEEFQKWLQQQLQRMNSGAGISTPDELQQSYIAGNLVQAQTQDTTARAIDDAKRNVG